MTLPPQAGSSNSSAKIMGEIRSITFHVRQDFKIDWINKTPVTKHRNRLLQPFP